MMIKILSYAVYVFYRLLSLTWRVNIQESPQLRDCINKGQLFVVAHWHGEEYGIMHLLARYHIACIISDSRDGQIADTMVRLLGAKTARGSSTRGAVRALKGILKLAKQGWCPSVAVDGPKGPRHEIKNGVLELARVLKAPIFSISMAPSRAKILEKAWNKGEIPLPFARLEVVWGEPISVPDKDSFDHARKLLSQSLHKGRKSAIQALES